jgi:signal transduction histidine kinase
MDNTRRLAKKEDLLPRIGGKDEVGALDLVFHIMAESLDDASRKNQELMKTVGQDLRKPLTTIQLSLNALSDGVFGDLTERAQKEISISEFNTARLINLISDLTDIEKLDSGKLDIELCQADLNQILEESVGVVSSYASRKQIALIVEPTEACIMADRNRLVQVLVNLLSNAVKFSPKGSTVKLAAERVANQIEVRVTDQGRGVPEEFRETIFERFKQVQKEDAKTDQGSGLGLAICKAIINGHNGTIGVTASAGSGSTFWFRIPAETGNGECHEIKVENNAE